MTGLQNLNRVGAYGLSLLAMVTWIGCTGSTGTLSAAGAKVLLDTEPSEVVGIVELKSAMVTGLAATDGLAAIVGRVVAGQDWEPDQATFLVRDLQADSAHGHDHGGGDHSDCAFCQAKERETGSLAMIRIVDDQGRMIEMNARKLLNLEEGHVVVAQGSGALDEDGSLVFSATKIFIRQSE